MSTDVDASIQDQAAYDRGTADRGAAQEPALSDDMLAPAPLSDRFMGWLLVVGGLIGALAAFVLAVEKFLLLTNPGYDPSCSINPVLSCGSVMATEQAEVFGFPNPLLGVASFPVVAASGAALLGGARLARWYWLGLQLGVIFGVGFVGWLFYQSLYSIGALCPYCMVVWTVTVPLFWYVTVRNATSGVFGDAVRRSPLTRFAAQWHAVVLTSVLIVVLGLIADRFWYYWSTLV